MQALSPISLDRPDAAIAADFGASFERHGFAVISDHGLPADLLAEAWALSKAYFGQSEAEKRETFVPGGAGQRGYTPYKTEIARDATVHDLKEFYHIGRPGGEALGMPANVWPYRPRGFQPVFTRLYEAFDRLGIRLLSYIALYLGLDRDWFRPAVEQGNSILRLLHYPPVEADGEGAVRAGAHGDINLITLLVGAEEAGLEILGKDGAWLAVEPPPGGLVVNVGDMLERLTAGMLPSTLHRVVNPVGEAARRSRYSMPFFTHLRPDFLIEAPQQCLRDGRTAPEPILANDFLTRRLVEIGLIPEG